jgi:hypothetical protein
MGIAALTSSHDLTGRRWSDASSEKLVLLKKRLFSPAGGNAMHKIFGEIRSERLP